MTTQKFSPLQLELLKLYSFASEEEDLLAVKRFLANHFAEKLVKKVDEAIIKKGISETDLNKWANE